MTVPSIDPTSLALWYENRARGLVFTQSPTAQAYRLYFPELVGKRYLEIVTIIVDERAAHCEVAAPFAALFKGETRSFFFQSAVLFSCHGGFDVEEAATITPQAWLNKNVRAAESLLALIEERQAFYRDEHLPEWDLRSRIFEMFAKDYKFRRREFASAELAAVEFCRRFADNKSFLELFHPEISSLRFFQR